MATMADDSGDVSYSAIKGNFYICPHHNKHTTTYCTQRSRSEGSQYGTRKMRTIPDSISCLVLLLLSELIGRSVSHPAHSPALCSLFGPMVLHVEKLINLSQKLHELSDDDLNIISVAHHRLDSLLEIPHTASSFSSMKINETVSQMYNFSESYRLHMDWLKTARENVSLPTQSIEGASRHLQQLKHLLDTSLNQLQEEVPQAPLPSLPPVSTAFDALKFSVEISEKLRVFSLWTKRSIRLIQRHLRCPRRT